VPVAVNGSRLERRLRDQQQPDLRRLVLRRWLDWPLSAVHRLGSDEEGARPLASNGGSGGVLALNDLGLAGGSVTDPAGTYAALWWGAEHSVPAHDMPSTINGVNNLGWAVGSIGSRANARGAVPRSRTIDLSGTVSGYTLIKGDAINNVDQISSTGRLAGPDRVLLLTPASAKSR